MIGKFKAQLQGQPENPQLQAKIRNKYAFFSAVLKQYVRHSQRVDSMSKAQTLAALHPIINTLIEQYHFGSRFAKEIGDFVNQIYYQTPMQARQTMMSDAQLSENDFTALMDEFKDSSLAKTLRPTFQSILR